MSPAPKTPKEEAPAAPPADAPAAVEEKAPKKEKTPKTKEGKEGKEPGKGKTPKPGAGPLVSKKIKKPIPDNPNFRYIVRVSDSDLDGTRSTALALSTLRGLGPRTADVVCLLAQVNPMEMIGNLPEATVEGIESIIAELPQKVPAWMMNHPRDYSGRSDPALHRGRARDVSARRISIS